MPKRAIASILLALILSSCAYTAQDRTGITIGHATKQTNGILINEVKAGGPAEEVGIRKGDVIVSYDGKKITDIETMQKELAETPPDKKVVLEVMREDNLFNVELTFKRKGWQFINVSPADEFPDYAIRLIDDFLWIGTFPYPVELSRFVDVLQPSPYHVYDPDHFPPNAPTLFMMTIR